MNAQQRVAWVELSISAFAIIATISVYPWLGERAGGMFGVLGLLGVTPLLLRRRNDQVVSDERDQMITQQATFFGVGAGWMILFAAILVLTLLVDFEGSAVPKGFLILALSISFAMTYAVKGGLTLLLYRIHPHAS